MEGDVFARPRLVTARASLVRAWPPVVCPGSGVLGVDAQGSGAEVLLCGLVALDGDVVAGKQVQMAPAALREAIIVPVKIAAHGWRPASPTRPGQHVHVAHRPPVRLAPAAPTATITTRHSQIIPDQHQPPTAPLHRDPRTSVVHDHSQPTRTAVPAAFGESDTTVGHLAMVGVVPRPAARGPALWPRPTARSPSGRRVAAPTPHAPCVTCRR